MQITLLTFQSIIQTLLVLVDFAIVWVLVYYVLKIVRNNSRTVQIFKGIVLVAAMWFVAYKFNLKTIQSLLDYAMRYGLLIVVIIFQPELRSMLERLGKTSVFSAIHSLSVNEKDKLIDELVDATAILASKKTGALITLEQGHSLTDYIKTGKPLNSTVTSELLTSIFVTSTPLHDGAVILQGNRIAAASAYYPPTNQDLPTRYGARHRAAIGISEITDSITIVVSEETGTISIAENGRLREMDANSLREYLKLIIQNVESEVSHSITAKRQRRFNLTKLNIDPIKIEKVESDEFVVKKLSKHQEKVETSRLMNLFQKKPGKDKSKNDTQAPVDKKEGVLKQKDTTKIETLKKSVIVSNDDDKEQKLGNFKRRVLKVREKEDRRTDDTKTATSQPEGGDANDK